MKTKQNVISTLLIVILAFALGACSSATDGSGETSNSMGTEQNTTVPTDTQGGIEEINSTTSAESNETASEEQNTTASTDDTGTNTNEANTTATNESNGTVINVNGTTEQNTTTSTGNDTNTNIGETNSTTSAESNETTQGEENTTTPAQNNTNTTTAETNTSTQTEAPVLQSLKLTVTKTSLNKDENTTLKAEATYADNSTKDVTDKVQWVATPSDAVKVSNTTLTALQDTATTLSASLDGIRSNAVHLDITWRVNGHKLPPEPDKALNDSTLLGIDVNNNDVRDDVERWIYETYKDKHPIYIDIAMQASREYKKILETPEKAKEIHDEVSKADYCQLYYMFDAKYYNEPILIQENAVDEYFRSKIYFNTKDRYDAYIQYDTLLSGDSYTLPKDKEEKAACDFNTSKYK